LKFNIIAILSIGICIVGSVIFYVAARAGKSDNQVMKAVYHDRTVKIINKGYLAALLEQYADIGEERLSNQAVTDDVILQFGKTGLKIVSEYPKGKKLPVSDLQPKFQVDPFALKSEKWILL
jgi:hypothetical protein